MVAIIIIKQFMRFIANFWIVIIFINIRMFLLYNSTKLYATCLRHISNCIFRNILSIEWWRCYCMQDILCKQFTLTSGPLQFQLNTVDWQANVEEWHKIKLQIVNWGKVFWLGFFFDILLHIFCLGWRFSIIHIKYYTQQI